MSSRYYYLKNTLSSRADGRKLEERRPFSISAEIIKTADGSAIVKQVKIFPFPWHYLRYKEGLRWYANPFGTFGANSSKKNVGMPYGSDFKIKI